MAIQGMNHFNVLTDIGGGATFYDCLVDVARIR